MLQPAGDLGLQQEALSAGRVVGVAVEDLFERHLAVKFRVEMAQRDEVISQWPGLVLSPAWKAATSAP
jgi:hypothetical protein